MEENFESRNRDFFLAFFKITMLKISNYNLKKINALAFNLRTSKNLKRQLI